MDCECQLAEMQTGSGNVWEELSMENDWGNVPGANCQCEKYLGELSGWWNVSGIVNGECQPERLDLHAGLHISCSGDDLLPPWLAQTHTDPTASDQLYTTSSAS